MIVKCIGNTGQFLRPFEYSKITNPEVFGRFGVSSGSQFSVQVGESYRVMGIFIFQEYQGIYWTFEDISILIPACYLTSWMAPYRRIGSSQYLI
jgi:hypothetical protein